MNGLAASVRAHECLGRVNLGGHVQPDLGEAHNLELVGIVPVQGLDGDSHHTGRR